MTKSTSPADGASTTRGNGEAAEAAIYDPAESRYEDAKHNEINIASLQRMTMKELIEVAREEKIGDHAGLKKQDLIFRILKERTKLNG
ncbi:MAG: Rho termination factor N-terminal domain-containing protein, partial [Planctomycetaceae bacterium]|nr:Rho termination factor N-terminal domain-containing protein [Planctomycetaceae bacterium]